MCHPAVSVHTLFKQGCVCYRTDSSRQPFIELKLQQETKGNKLTQPCQQTPPVALHFLQKEGSRKVFALGHTQHLLLAAAR